MRDNTNYIFETRNHQSVRCWLTCVANGSRFDAHAFRVPACDWFLSCESPNLIHELESFDVTRTFERSFLICVVVWCFVGGVWLWLCAYLNWIKWHNSSKMWLI